MIDITNESGSPSNEEGLVGLATFALDRLRIHPSSELSIILVDEETMEAYHEKFMGLPGPTDVLSFPMDEMRAPGDDEDPPSGYSVTSCCARPSQLAKLLRMVALPTGRRNTSSSTGCCTCSATTMLNPERSASCLDSTTRSSRHGMTIENRQVSGDTARMDRSGDRLHLHSVGKPQCGHGDGPSTHVSLQGRGACCRR